MSIRTSSSGSPTRLRSDTRGAVYVELLIVFLPVMVFFLSLLQLSLLFSSKLLVEHAAVEGARAAAVVFADEPAPYGPGGEAANELGGARREAVRDAVLVSLAPLVLNGSVARVDVAFPPADRPGGPDQAIGSPLSPMGRSGATMIRVRVEADVVCKIALADVLVCDGSAPIRVARATAEATFPYQGASYVYE